MKKPKILLVGAGIGGLILGNLLQKSNIPFLIFERARQVKPLDSTMSMGSNLASLFSQIDILDEFKEIGKHMNRKQVFDENLKPIYGMTFTEREKVSGNKEYIVSRPDLYDLLLRQIPKEKINMNQKVLSILQNDLGVMIRCHDGSTHHGDIFVGADGAYSAVRRQLYKDLKDKKKLLKSDKVPLSFSCVCLADQTEVLDPEEFPDLNLPES
ncbi:hypothetical protein BGZ59_010973 [Podila verticillata]|nr:hypothetical protein BGZ59_010973 [Podila verticillata]